MKLLAFSDLHRDRRRARRLVALAREADVVIGAGDLASMRLGLNRTIDELRPIGKPTLLVPGNAESDAALWRACARFSEAQVLHGESTQIGQVTFFGLGGAIPPTPLPWSFDLGEDEAASKLERCPAGAVLVVHAPPRGYVDEARGRNFGSESVLRAIESKRPRLVLCGHIHESWGREAQIGPSRVVNLGPEGRFFEV